MIRYVVGIAIDTNHRARSQRNLHQFTVDVEAIVSGASVGGVAIDVVDAVARRAPRARLAVLSFVKEPTPH